MPNRNVPGRRGRHALLCLLGVAALLAAGCRDNPQPADTDTVRIVGTVWQPDTRTAHPQGIWERLGAHTLLVQWTAMGNHSFVGACTAPDTAPAGADAAAPDWKRIAREPWAQEVILGLAGEGDEAAARRSVAVLVERSKCLAALPTPLKVSGWYFPVEVDPTWKAAAELPAQLERLPRPLWISVYDTANVGPEALATWLDGWLPKDVGVFFQDGVGVNARSAPVVREYLAALQKHLGAKRVRLIAEAFRPAVGGGFRAATLEELVPQLTAYRGQEVFLFDGPHYVDIPLVEGLRDRLLPVQ